MAYRDFENRQTFEQEGEVLSEEVPLHELGNAFFEMTTIEEADEYFFQGAHRHDFYELLWFRNVGAGQSHCIDFIRCPIADNQVFLLLPGQVHSIDQRGKSGFLIAVSRDFFERQLGRDMMQAFSYSTNFNVVIPDEMVQVLSTLTDLIKNEYEGECRPAILESYLRSWLLHCIELQKQINAVSHSDPRLHALIGFIEANYRKQRHADFYAKQLSISAKRLNELTRESFGKTINQMVSERLILEAKREIGDIRKPIKEISYELGFSEPAYFSRFFGKQTGLSPQDFRKRIAALNN
ncbi:helix-turn-helix domain-containing protein [Dyadobacter sp. Leaf189]|uniref:helix-turn-helix domain-containing protein n=1 Tax=Dyadobacter sp. Leaf189 TaxID=1736295 RepID=UPI0009E7E338|nr:helix-turn-helix domain-containing protein [Dyadobacter sp. Leaf189]